MLGFVVYRFFVCGLKIGRFLKFIGCFCKTERKPRDAPEASGARE